MVYSMEIETKCCKNSSNTLNLRKISNYNIEIKWPNAEKYLGVTLNESLSQHTQVSTTMTKVKRSKRALRSHAVKSTKSVLSRTVN